MLFLLPHPIIGNMQMQPARTGFTIIPVDLRRREGERERERERRSEGGMYLLFFFYLTKKV